LGIIRLYLILGMTVRLLTTLQSPPTPRESRVRFRKPWRWEALPIQSLRPAEGFGFIGVPLNSRFRLQKPFYFADSQSHDNGGDETKTPTAVGRFVKPLSPKWSNTVEQLKEVYLRLQSYDILDLNAVDWGSRRNRDLSEAIRQDVTSVFKLVYISTHRPVRPETMPAVLQPLLQQLQKITEEHFHLALIEEVFNEARAIRDALRAYFSAQSSSNSLAEKPRLSPPSNIPEAKQKAPLPQTA